MNDDTKALVERARELAGYKYQHHTLHVPAVLNLLAGTIERLERELDAALDAKADWHQLAETYKADRDALAERCEKLREALREQVVYGKRQTLPNTHKACGMCEEEWDIGSTERHAEGCLAAPKDSA